MLLLYGSRPEPPPQLLELVCGIHFGGLAECEQEFFQLVWLRSAAEGVRHRHRYQSRPIISTLLAEWLDMGIGHPFGELAG